MTLKFWLRVVQGHWKWRRSIDHIRLTSRLPLYSYSSYLVSFSSYLTLNECIGDNTKGAARRSPNCIRKTKQRSVERRYRNYALPKFYDKLFPHANVHLNWAIATELWPKKRLLKQQTSTILDFKNVPIWSSGCRRVPDLHLCTKFHQNRTIFRWHVAILPHAIWRPSGFLNFRNLEVISRDLYCHAVLLPCAKFHWNRTIGC